MGITCQTQPGRRVQGAVLKDERSTSFLLLNISFLLLLRRLIGNGRRFLRWLRLCNNSLGIHDVDKVIANIASAIDLGDTRSEEFRVTE